LTIKEEKENEKYFFIFDNLHLFIFFNNILNKKNKKYFIFKSKFKYLIIKKLNILKLEKLQNISKT
jgi:hypothetical protein